MAYILWQRNKNKKVSEEIAAIIWGIHLQIGALEKTLN